MVSTVLRDPELHVEDDRWPRKTSVKNISAKADILEFPTFTGRALVAA